MIMRIKNKIKDIIKIKDKKRFFKILLIFGIISIIIYNLFFNINNIKGRYLYSVTSPDKTKEASVYVVESKSSLSADGVLVTIYDKKKIKLRRIYHDYPKSNAKVSWENNATIVIDGKKMNIYKDQYDSRKEW